MVKGKKISKKKLKEPDEFLTVTERTFLFVAAHQKKFVLGGTVVVVLLLATILFQMWEGRKEREASLRMDLAMQAYQTVSSPYRNATPTETKGVLQRLDEIAKAFPSTLSGKLSLLYQGNLHLELAEFDEAIKAYEAFLSKSGDEGLYTVLSLQGLGYAREGKKEYEKAIEAYQKILAEESFESKEAHLNIGRCYEKLGKNEEALEHYKAFLEGKQKSLMTDLVLRKISLLEK